MPGKPDRPGAGDGRPGIADRPSTLPSRPGGGLGVRPPDPPGRPARPERPDWGDKWNGRDNNFVDASRDWNVNVQNDISNFNVNRNNYWGNCNRWGAGWAGQWNTPGYNAWRGDLWRYRGYRCNELWYRCGPLGYHNHFFNHHWWGTCWWRPRPLLGYAYSPWWWWRPFRWTYAGAFWAGAVVSQPIYYDPGTTVIYEGDTVYINGESAGDATAYRQQTIALANPEVDEVPVPEPAGSEAEQKEGEAPQGDWLPVGVWALTQQEQGDATMFFQLSIDKNGIVAGAYKNVMTGDEHPVVGQLDFKTQRVAWHIGQVTKTVYETGLSSFENDVAGVFVHFGEGLTQNWLLVRMPSPEMPPGTVQLPEIAKAK